MSYSIRLASFWPTSSHRSLSIILLAAVFLMADVALAASKTIKITRQPVAKTFTVGKTFQLSLGAKGSGTVRYQWYKDGKKISGGTSRWLTVKNPKSSAAGKYYARVTDKNGSTNSRTVTVKSSSGSSTTKTSTGDTSSNGVKTRNQFTLSWKRPTKREDGSSLSSREIVAYRIYHIEKTPKTKERVHEVGASTTKITLKNLLKGSHTFAMTTVDSQGQESDLTKAIKKSFSRN